jgi:Glycerophosphoryl diester phosphodiesterase family
VWLIDGQLLVAHDRDKVDPARTLQRLYLNPLRERVVKNHGRVFRDGPSFSLMIDFKADATNTYRALLSTLKDYETMLTTFHSNRTETNAVTIVISGNRPGDLMQSEPIRLAAYDGRLSDLDRGWSPRFAPWISDNWRTVFKWDGNSDMPNTERHLLRDIVARAHRQGMKLRLWGAPDRPPVWRELMAAGVDLINTDRLAEFREFALRHLEKTE